MRDTMLKQLSQQKTSSEHNARATNYKKTRCIINLLLYMNTLKTYTKATRALLCPIFPSFQGTCQWNSSPPHATNPSIQSPRSLKEGRCPRFRGFYKKESSAEILIKTLILRGASQKHENIRWCCFMPAQKAQRSAGKNKAGPRVCRGHVSPKGGLRELYN